MIHSPPPRGWPRHARVPGFTLVELLVVIAVAGILLAIGVPSLREFRDRSAVRESYQLLRSSLARARSEAVTRGATVSVCALDPASASSGAPRCRAGGQDWSAGWIVFVDADDRGDLGEDDIVVSVVQAPANPAKVVGTLRYLSFRPTGVLMGIASHFRILPPGSASLDQATRGAVLVCVNKTGKPRLTDDTACHG